MLKKRFAIYSLSLFVFAWTSTLMAQTKSPSLNPNDYIQQRTFSEPESAASAEKLKSEVVAIGSEKYLKIIGEQGTLYLPYLGDLKKDDIFNSSTCTYKHKHHELKEKVVQDYENVLEAKIKPQIKLYAGLVVKTIKDKCTNQTEALYLPKNPGEVGVEVKQDDKSYKIYNRFEPRNVDTKNPEKLVNPGLGVGKQF